MTAEPLLDLVARLLAKHGLDPVLIGNAAAALQALPMEKRTGFLRRRRSFFGSSL